MKKNILEILLDSLRVKYTHFYFSKLYNEHPYKENMLGLQMMLSEYNIESTGIKSEDKDLNDLTFPCILHLKNKFILVTNIDGEVLECFWENKLTKINNTIINQEWDGNALIIDSAKNAKEPDYKKNFRKEKLEHCQYMLLIGIPLIFTLIGAYRNIIENHTFQLLILVINLIGSLVCGLLIQKQVFKESKTADKICNIFHKGKCDDVLKSSESRLFNEFSWSEIGMSYFLSMSLFIATWPQIITSICLINWVAMPFAIWSIWYQGKKVKRFCPLCIIVQILIWSNGLVSMYYYIISNHPYSINIFFLCILCMIVLYSLIITHLLIRLVDFQNVSTNTLQKFRKLKSDANVFATLLTKNKYFNTSIDNSHIIFGNPDAELKITILTNPHCRPCALIHKEVTELLLSYSSELSVQYIFVDFNETLKNSSRFLIAVYQQMPPDEVKKIYEQWYNGAKYNANSYISQFDLNLTDTLVNNELNIQDAYKKKIQIKETPTILVNGYAFPRDFYELKDLIYLFYMKKKLANLF